MKRALWISLFCLCYHFGVAALVSVDSMRTADLLFVVNHKGNAITSVTEGYDQLPIDHVAIFFRDTVNLSPGVVQADYHGVRICCIQNSFRNVILLLAS